MNDTPRHGHFRRVRSRWRRLAPLAVLIAGVLLLGLVRTLAALFGYQPNPANLPVTLLLSVLLTGAVYLVWRATRPRRTFTLEELLEAQNHTPDEHPGKDIP